MSSSRRRLVPSEIGFRDVAQMFLQRGYEVSHETIRIWEFRLAPSRPFLIHW